MYPDNLIYHLCRRADWHSALEDQAYKGSGDDLRDGFLHFSTRDQVAESAARHRAGVSDLLLLGADPDSLGESLKWEASRGGQLFPHLYGEMPVACVVRVEELPLGERGYHQFPGDIPGFDGND